MKYEFIAAIEINCEPMHELPYNQGRTTYHQNPDLKICHFDCGLIFAQRERLESNTSYRQIIPYTVIKNDKGEILTYRRLPASGEARLSGKVSIGFGGHLDLQPEFANNPPPTLDEMILSCLSRELDEELVLDNGEFNHLTNNAKYSGYLVGYTGVNAVHLGVVVEVSSGTLFDNKELTTQDPAIEILGWFKPNDLLEMVAGEKLELEEWSQVILEK